MDHYSSKLITAHTHTQPRKTTLNNDIPVFGYFFFDTFPPKKKLAKAFLKLNTISDQQP